DERLSDGGKYSIGLGASDICFHPDGLAGTGIGALYLAEIFLSGLLCPEPLATESSNKRQKMPQYDFVDGVRALLQGTIPISEAQAVGEEVAEAVFKQLPPDVQQRVNADIERRFGDALSYFEAFLIPDLPWGDSAATEIFPFARVTGQMMQLWGGAYAALVEDLESCREESGQQPSKQPIDEIEALVALDQHMEAIRRQIAETFSEQEHDFGLNIHPREEAALGAIEEIILEDGEISVETFEQNLIERSQEYVSFEVSVRINFSVQIRYFDFDAYHPETEDVPTFGDTVPNQTVDGVAEITLWFAEEDRNEAEPELVRLRVEQPILINPTPPEVDSFSIPTLQTFEFEMATIAFAESPSPGIALEPFEFEIVTIARQNRSTVQPTTELPFDHFLRTLEEEIAAETGHGFNDLEREVLTGALQGKSYKEIHR
ncbi:MAG: hypothetical protein LH647_18040, partial [Leptolyngbyaceae cyanobacterium CAN_BIN12]|nr:hypothetical protein [Leptolyngbyaceae cyanobacterium CAN_BIN12]